MAITQAAKMALIITSVVVGAAIGIGGTELIQWWKRPRLEIDLDIFPNLDFNDYEAQTEDYHGNQAVYKAKFLRLVVKNKGKSAALNCEAKLTLKHASEIHTGLLHWTKRDPILYRRFEDGKKILDLDKIFAPIDISRSNNETLDVIKFPYWYSTAPNADHSGKRDTTSIYLPPPLNNLIILSDDDYYFEVTVYARNANAEDFKFHCKWDGTIEGFNRAFTKDLRSKTCQTNHLKS